MCTRTDFRFKRRDQNFRFLLFLLSPYSWRGNEAGIIGEKRKKERERKPVLSLPPVFRVRVDEHWATVLGCVVKHDMGGKSPNGFPLFFPPLSLRLPFK